MSTKWYIYSTTPDFSPSSHQGTWSIDASSDSSRYMSLTRSRTGVAISTKTRQKTAASVQTLLGAIAVSPPLAAQTIGTFSLDTVLRYGESASTMDAFTQFHVYVTVGDTNSVRGTLLSNTTGSSEMSTTAAGKSSGFADIPGLAIQDGDRIVIEMGAKSNSSVNSQIVTMGYGGTSTSTDLVSGSTSTTNPGYVQFSQTLLYSVSKEVTASGFVIVQTAFEGTGIVKGENTKQITANGVVRDTVTLEATAQGLVADVTNLEFTVDGLVYDLRTKEITASGLMIGEFEKEFTGDSYVTLGNETHADITGSGLVFATNNKEVSGSASVQDTFTLSFSGSAITQDIREKDITGSGTVSYKVETDFTADATAIISTNKQVTWTGTGYAIIAIPQIKEVAASGYISLFPEIYCDAIVTNEVSSSGLVRLNTGELTDNDWYLTYAEQTNGSQFLNTIFLSPYEFVAGFDSTITHIALCLDLSSANSTLVETITYPATLGIQIKDFSGNVVSDNTYGNTYWADIKTDFSTPGWFAFELQSPVNAFAEASYTVEIVANTYSPTLLTTAVTNNYEIIRRELNCIVITSEQPVSMDNRPMYVLPVVQNDASIGYVLETGQINTINSLVVGPRCTVKTTTSENLTVNVNSLIQVLSGGLLQIKPDNNKQHKFKFAVGAGMQFFGSLETEGHTKTQFSQSLASISGSQKIVTLTSSPSGWKSGDLVYINNPGFPGGFTLIVESVAGNQLTLKTGVGQSQINSGAYIVNISHDVMFTGESSTSRGFLSFQGNGSNSIEKTSFRNMGGPSCIKGLDESEISLSDVSISGMLTSASTGDVGLYYDEHITSASPLTVVEAGSAATVISPWVTDLIIAGLTDAHSGVRLKSAMTGTVRGITHVGGIIGMYDGSSFVGSILSTGTGSDGSLACCVSGIAKELLINGGEHTVLSGASSAGVLRLKSGGIGKVVFENLITNAPYVIAETSALFLGNGRASHCTSTATKPITMTSNMYLNFTDEDNPGLFTTVASVIGTGSLLPGSDISTRYFSCGAHGYRYIQGVVVDSGASSLYMHSYGDEYKFKLTDIAVGSGETLTLNLRVKGDVTISLDSAIATISSSSASNADFDTLSVTTTSVAAGVISVYVSTTTDGYIDGLTRGD